MDGEKMEDKGVDFAIVLRVNQEERVKVQHTIKHLQEWKSVNQTMCGTLQYQPSFLTIETKLPFQGGQEADVQLITWASAGIKKLRQMLNDNGQSKAAIPTMPLLSFHGDDVHLSALQEGSENNLYLPRLRIGSTATVPEMFQLVKALDILMEWGHSKYRPWFFQTVAKNK